MKIGGIKYTDTSITIAMLALRLGLGLMMMITHGFDKLKHFGEKAGNFSDPFHISSTLSLSLVVFAEFFCSCFIILGLFTRLACIPLIVAMTVALFYSHNGQFLGGGEKAALYLVGYIVLIFAGPGKVSMDRFIGK